MIAIFVRHGQTIENQQGISMGQSIGGTLNETGKRQAKQIAVRLARYAIKYIYSSDLKRSIDTAIEIGRLHPKAEIIPVNLLRERNLGVFEGLPNQEWRTAMENSTQRFSRYKPPLGESYEELSRRTNNFIQTLTVKHLPDDTIVIVSHAGTLAIIYMNLLNRLIKKETYEYLKPKNCSLTSFEILDGKPTRLIVLNSNTNA